MNRRSVLISVGLLVGAVSCGLLTRTAASLGREDWVRLLIVAALLLSSFSVALLVSRLLRRGRMDSSLWRRSLRLTGRGTVFLLVVTLLGASTLNSGNNLLILVLSTLVAALLVSGFGSNLVLQNLHISLKLPSRIHAEQKAVFLLGLRNQKRWMPSFGVRLRNRRSETTVEESTDFFRQQQHFPYLGPGGCVELQMEASFRERGAYSLEGFEITTRFPFGLLQRSRRLEARGVIFVYPRLLKIESVMQQYPALRGAAAGDRPGSGGEVYTVRDYRSGDRRQTVHWKATARTGRLMVKEFLAEDEPPHRLYLDRAVASAAEEADFEGAVSAVTTIVQVLWQGRQRVHVATDQFAGEVASAEGYQEVMRHLALVKPRVGEAPFFPRHREPGQVFFSAGRPWGAPYQGLARAGSA